MSQENALPYTLHKKIIAKRTSATLLDRDTCVLPCSRLLNSAPHTSATSLRSLRLGSRHSTVPPRSSKGAFGFFLQNPSLRRRLSWKSIFFGGRTGWVSHAWLLPFCGGH